METRQINRKEWLTKVSLLIAGGAFSNNIIRYANQLTSYVDQKNIIRLSSNENPYGPSENVLNAIAEHSSNTGRYPFSLSQDLKETLGEYHNLPSDYFLLGAGSSQLLEILAYWSFHEQLGVTYCEPSFNIYPDLVRDLGGLTQKIPLTNSFEYPLDRLKSATSSHRGICYIVNPNNPTGVKIPESTLRKFCSNASSRSYLIIDEAYIEYENESESVIDMIAENSRIIVLRTFSKIYGLAGLRVGYIVAHPDVILQLNEFSIWDNHSLNSLGYVAAEAALKDRQFVQYSIDANKRIRNEVVEELNKLGITPLPSSTSFILFKTPNNDDLQSKLNDLGIRIGQLTYNQDVLARVTIGTENEMKTFIQQIRNIYN